jgi:hypothetical protein
MSISHRRLCSALSAAESSCDTGHCPCIVYAFTSTLSLFLSRAHALSLSLAPSHTHTHTLPLHWKESTCMHACVNEINACAHAQTDRLSRAILSLRAFSSAFASSSCCRLSRSSSSSRFRSRASRLCSSAFLCSSSRLNRSSSSARAASASARSCS